MARNDHYTVFYERARVLTGRSNWHRALCVDIQVQLGMSGTATLNGEGLLI